MKPTVYIETTIIGHLTSRVPQDPLVAGQMVATRKWWDESRQHFQLLTSEVARVECSRGDPQAASERLELIANLTMAQALPDFESLAELLLVRHALPAKARIDAFHVAIAPTNSIEYLLTWNCRHLANATMRTKIEATCQERGYPAPIICTPYELMEVRDV
ncbi:MAG TPA: type II toxin-antitoxin system VapC family toxin [Tepidisphaeraceae bacterium]|nr:type II toxin-antitoxin system VapC family toxin [Tepidisphaeraceae bacterium]